MSLSKAVIVKMSREWNTSEIVRTWWHVQANNGSNWQMKSCHNITCSVCLEEKPNLLLCCFYNYTTLCLECIEYVIAKTEWNRDFIVNQINEIQLRYLSLKKEKQDLKQKISLEKKEKKDNKIHYYSLKSKLSLLKSEKEELKQKEKTLQAQNEAIESNQILPNKEALRTKEISEKKCYQWISHSHETELYTKRNGSCKKCNGVSLTVLYMKDGNCSFCIQCIRSFFAEMKLTIDEMELVLEKLKQEEMNETAHYEASKAYRQKKILQMEEKLKQEQLQK